jgi:hypothetical protein
MWCVFSEVRTDILFESVIGTLSPVDECELLLFHSCKEVQINERRHYCAGNDQKKVMYSIKILMVPCVSLVLSRWPPVSPERNQSNFAFRQALVYEFWNNEVMHAIEIVLCAVSRYLVIRG